MSTLYGPDGEIKGQWVKSVTDKSPEDTIEDLKEALSGVKKAPRIPKPRGRRTESLLTVYPIADYHLGMYAWAAETGQDFDLMIADRLFMDTMSSLIADAPKSETAVILNLGDFLHSDSDENRTRRSGNPLDVDTRYAKVLQLGVQLLANVIMLSLQKHGRVIVRNIPGNHDPYGTLALTVALDAYFRNEPRVTVDLDPGPFWRFRFGSVLLVAAHGDRAKLEDMPGVVAAKWPEEWGATKYRYVYGGHWHTRKKWPTHERAGATVEVFRTMCPKDAWTNSMGFTSGREAVAITHELHSGEVSRIINSIRWPE